MIDDACRRILIAKQRLGLFDDPYKYCKPERLAKDMYTPRHRKIARDIAAETVVLLKNDKHLLPLQKKGRIALIGPLANAANNMSGTWSGYCKPEITSRCLTLSATPSAPMLNCFMRREAISTMMRLPNEIATGAVLSLAGTMTRCIVRP